MALIDNKKVFHNYEIVEKFEAGIELFGHEVKSLRAGRGSLDGAYVSVGGGEPLLVGAHISPYQQGNVSVSYDPIRKRRLLLNKKEIERLIGMESKGGLTLVPIAMYNKGRKIKLEIGLARGKKKYDKREVLKKRESSREMERTLKNR